MANPDAPLAPLEGPPPPTGGEGSSGTTVPAQVVQVMPPKPFVPEVKAPVFDNAALDKITAFLTSLKFYYNYLIRKGMRPADAIYHICNVCFEYPTAKRWAQVTEFTGTWDDFQSKLLAKWVRPQEKERAGHTLLYSTSAMPLDQALP
jgi:hypothetical protein